MSNILIAALGDSPIVVTGMFKLVGEKVGAIDKVVVLYPEGKLIPFGYLLIEEALRNKCTVENWELPFEDANSEDDSYQFLRELFDLLSKYQAPEDIVYLSLAGGRKNMSALMALVVPFFPHIQKLYHILDRHEDTSRHNFKSIQELLDFPNDLARQRALDPSSKDLILVDIPFNEQQRADKELIEKLSRLTSKELEWMWETDTVKAQVAEFYGWFSQPNTPKHVLPVFVTEYVKEEYEKMRSQNAQLAQNFAICFEYMRSATLLKGALHGSPPGKVSGNSFPYHFYKRHHTQERPFYHTEPGDIYSYPSSKIPVEKVIISGLAIEREKKYEPKEEVLLQLSLKAQKELQAGKQLYHVEALFPKDSILVVPLGNSPMIATQLYTLLKSQEGRIIQEVILLYPEGHEKLRTSAKLVKEAFDEQNIKCDRVPVAGLRDIDSTEACEIYQRTLEEKIREVRNDHPYWTIDLALSGGRKGMTAMAMFAAQKVGLHYLYHTLITNEELDERVQLDTQLEVLNGGISRKEFRDRLFLNAYKDDLDKFVLFKVPVVPLSKG